MAPRSVAAAAPAKLNLFLDVLGPRDDGYHELETLFVALDFADRVTLREAPDAEAPTRLEIEGPVQLPVTADNLALRAVARFREATGFDTPLDVVLEKYVPPGQGLGGGSSDAATVLRLLEELAGEPLEEAHRRELALALGSDVPFFLDPRASIGRGRGERLEPVGAHPSFEAVLILPGIECSTPVVFKNLAARIRSAPPGGLRTCVAALRSGDPAMLRATHYNALAVPAIAAYPALARFTSDVERRLGRPPCLSGSGAALYDLPDPGRTAAVLDALDGLPGSRLVVRF